MASKAKAKAKTVLVSPYANPFIRDPDHFGGMTVRQLMEIVTSNPSEYPLGPDTNIGIGDVEGNLGVSREFRLYRGRRPYDVVLAIDENGGDMNY